MKATWITSFFALMLALPLAHAADNMKAFPVAEKGMTRHVLQLPAQSDESAYKVELIVGKEVATDERNRYFFGGVIEEKNIEGWGYTRYVVPKLGPMAGTMMAIDPNAPKVTRFISLSGGPYLIRYNSRLPVVVYVPQGVEVRYKIWRAGDEVKKIEQG
ncbi:proteinase inhibitor I4 serpin [Herminiimonas sp. KBW02]|uniref:ecotin n=1 Tax=Herminiimonas sp. KBW02 TaxID=2153363 RepID=UPI000F5937EA|nr:ecotin family protein [Herminiimonas sp. KBW02]RQO33999.1 proteinase inhibitor I4 serpin [Herminiimonas sp. KBW02]